jgi:hypothetical protein
MEPSLVIENAANASVIAFLIAGIRRAQLSDEAAKPPSAKHNVALFGEKRRVYDPPPLADPDIVRAQSHPEMIERIWQLGTVMPQDCRAIVYGAPALVHPQAGVIFVFGTGTVYFLRLPKALATEAIKAGAFTNHKWSFGGGMDIRQELGDEWIGGRWLQKEPSWCLEAYQRAGKTAL